MQVPLAHLVESAFLGCRRWRIPQTYRELCRILCSGQTISHLILWLSEGPSYAMLSGRFSSTYGTHFQLVRIREALQPRRLYRLRTKKDHRRARRRASESHDADAHEKVH